MVRLRYKSPRNDPTRVFSNLIVINRELIIFAMIDICDLTYSVMNADGQELFQGKEDTMRKCKSVIRKRFIELGVKFNDEIRHKKNTEQTYP